MTQALSYNSGYINIEVSREIARELAKSGTKVSHYANSELISTQITPHHCIVWDINQDHLWYVNSTNPIHIKANPTLITELRLLPTPESRIEYLKSK